MSKRGKRATPGAQFEEENYAHATHTETESQPPNPKENTTPLVDPPAKISRKDAFALLSAPTSSGAPRNAEVVQHQMNTGPQTGQPAASISGFVVDATVTGSNLRVTIAIEGITTNGSKAAVVSRNGRSAILLAEDAKKPYEYGEPTTKTIKVGAGTKSQTAPNIRTIAVDSTGSVQMIATGAVITVSIYWRNDGMADKGDGKELTIPLVGAKITAKGISVKAYNKEGKKATCYVNAKTYVLDRPAPTGKSTSEIMTHIATNPAVASLSAIALLSTVGGFQGVTETGIIGDAANLAWTMVNDTHESLLEGLARKLQPGAFDKYDEKYATTDAHSHPGGGGKAQLDNGEHLQSITSSITSIVEAARANGGRIPERSTPHQNGEPADAMKGTAFLYNSIDGTALAGNESALHIPQPIEQLYNETVKPTTDPIIGATFTASMTGQLIAVSSSLWFVHNGKRADESLEDDPAAPIALTTRFLAPKAARDAIPMAGIPSSGFKMTRDSFAKQIQAPDGNSLGIFMDEFSYCKFGVGYATAPRGLDVSQPIDTSFCDNFHVILPDTVRNIGVAVSGQWIKKFRADEDGFLSATVDEMTSFAITPDGAARISPVVPVDEGSVGKYLKEVGNTLNINRYSGRMKPLIAVAETLEWYVVAGGVRLSKAIDGKDVPLANGSTEFGEGVLSTLAEMSAMDDNASSDEKITQFLANSKAICFAIVKTAKA